MFRHRCTGKRLDMLKLCHRVIFPYTAIKHPSSHTVGRTHKKRFIITLRNQRAAMIDSFIALLNKADAEKFSRRIYYFNSYAARGVAFRFIPADGTMQQLKNSGNLRLIQKTSVSDSIIAYDVANRGYVWGNQDEEEIMDTYRNIAETVFDGRVLNAMRDEDNNVYMAD